MKTHVLRGSRQEIAEKLAEIDGEVLEVIVLVDEANPQGRVYASADDDIFAEMQPYMVESPDEIDDSREAIYTRMPGE